MDCAQGYYDHNPTYTFQPVHMTSNEISIIVYVYLDIDAEFQADLSRGCQHAFNLMCNTLYSPFYFLPEGRLFIKCALSVEARSPPTQ